MDKKGDTEDTQHHAAEAASGSPTASPSQAAASPSKKPAKSRAASKSKPPAEPKAPKAPVAEAKPKAPRASRPSRSSRAKTPPPPAVAPAVAEMVAETLVGHTQPAAIPPAPPSKRPPRSRKSGEHTLYGQEVTLPSVIVAPDVEVAAPVAQAAQAAPIAPAQAQPADARPTPALDETWIDHTRPATPRAIKSTPPPAPAPVEAAAAKAPSEREDDISIPPASTDIDERDEHFFKQGELAERVAREHARAALRPTSSPSLSDAFPPDPRLMQLASPAARARRARFEKYVKAVAGVSAILCLAALVRVGVARATHDQEPVVAHAASQIEPVANAAVLPAEPAKVDPPAPAAPPPGAIPAPPPEAPAEPEPVAEAVPEKSAAEEKKDARTLLEKYKVQDAIAAGERSVALDPTDGEAWLILGAAYQEAGKGADARRCFVSCTKEGKKGPIGECKLMLQ